MQFVTTLRCRPVNDEEFDLAALADYLHMPVGQVSRLAERGKLPGRRVAGQWRFSRPEVHHWLEDRLGVADDEELAQWESTLLRTQAADRVEAPFDLSGLLAPESVAKPLGARTRASVIAEMCRLAAATGMLWDSGKMADAVAAREALASTALDAGVALMHPRRPLPGILAQAVMALGVASQGIPFGGASGRLTDVFFLIAATSDHEYLRILARISRIVGDREWLAQLRQASDARAARELLLRRDAEFGDA